MKFYKIKANQIINLCTIRTAQAFSNEIYLTYTCGDTRSERVVFGSAEAAAEAFDNLCDALGWR